MAFPLENGVSSCLSRIERIAALVGIGTSLLTLTISIIELPRDLAALDVWMALSTSLVIVGLLILFWVKVGKKPHGIGLETKQITEEKRLRSEFPAIFTFIESVRRIRSAEEFEQFVARLNHLLELEKKARGIKWSEIKDIEAMKAIAYARLIAKRSDN